LLELLSNFKGKSASREAWDQAVYDAFQIQVWDLYSQVAWLEKTDLTDSVSYNLVIEISSSQTWS
jgi:hypothetical protein